MKSAFGIKLQPGELDSMIGSGPNGFVTFWLNDRGQWCGSLQVAAVNITETIGSASPEACYRSLRGRARNLARGLEKLGMKP